MHKAPISDPDADDFDLIESFDDIAVVCDKPAVADTHSKPDASIRASRTIGIVEIKQSNIGDIAEIW